MKSKKIYEQRHLARDETIWDDIDMHVLLFWNNEHFRCRFLCMKKPCKRQGTAVRFLNKYNRKIYYSYEWVKEI